MIVCLCVLACLCRRRRFSALGVGDGKIKGPNCSHCKRKISSCSKSSAGFTLRKSCVYRLYRLPALQTYRRQHKPFAHLATSRTCCLSFDHDTVHTVEKLEVENSSHQVAGVLIPAVSAITKSTWPRLN